MLSVASDNIMKQLGYLLGSCFKGGEVLELVGDVGVGKTTLTKGIGEGLRVDDDVQSPSFTISRVYKCRDNLELHHYDLYRLSEPGVVSFELAESAENPQAVTVVEWAETVQNVLPQERIRIVIRYEPKGESRQLDIKLPGGLEYLEIVQGDLV